MQTTSFINMDNQTAEGAIRLLRVRLTRLLLGFIALSSFLIAISQPDMPDLLTAQLPSLSGAVALIALLLLTLISVTDNPRYERVVRPIPVMWLTVLSFAVFDSDVALLMLMILATVTAALLTSSSVFWTVMGVVTVRVLVHIALLTQSAPVAIETLQGVLAGATVLGGIPLLTGLLVRYVIVQLESTARTAQRSADLLRASALIGQSMSEMIDTDELLPRAVDIIRDRFGFYHVQVFTVDDNENYAHLTASTGEVGEQMLARQHRLPIDNDSVVGRTALARETIIARETGRESGHSYNELLPHTRSEIGIPLLDGERVIGILDVQSTRTDVFNETELQALRVIASQLTTAIRNARLFAKQERNVRDNKRLFLQAETSLREIQRLNRQLTRQSWEDYLRSDERVSGVTLDGDAFNTVADWTTLMQQAGKRRRPIIEDSSDGKRQIAIPLELRGEVVGAIEMETDSQFNSDEISDMVQAISQRLAVSLDNARLFEETNEATAQEQRVSEIVSQYQTADTVDDLLRITLQGLAETLGAESGTIRLGALPDDLAAIESRSNGHASNGSIPNGSNGNGGSASS